MCDVMDEAVAIADNLKDVVGQLNRLLILADKRKIMVDISGRAAQCPCDVQQYRIKITQEL